MVSKKLIAIAFAAATCVSVEGRPKHKCGSKTQSSTAVLSPSSEIQSSSLAVTPEPSTWVSVSTTPSSSATSTPASTPLTSDLSTSNTPVSTPSASISSNTPSSTPASTSSIIASTTSTHSAVPSPVNLVLNGDFEASLAPWVNDDQYYSSVQLAENGLEGYAGSAHYFGATLAPGRSGLSISVTQTLENLDATKTYRLTYHCGLGNNRDFDPDNENNHILVRAFVGGPEQVAACVVNENAPAGPNWETASETFTGFGGSVSLTFYLSALWGTGDGFVDAMLDAVSVVEVA